MPHSAHQAMKLQCVAFTAQKLPISYICFCVLYSKTSNKKKQRTTTTTTEWSKSGTFFPCLHIIEFFFLSLTLVYDEWKHTKTINRSNSICESPSLVFVFVPFQYFPFRHIKASMMPLSRTRVYCFVVIVIGLLHYAISLYASLRGMIMIEN